MSRQTHDDRETQVITDLESSFRGFAGASTLWTKVPDGWDPPDFVAALPLGSVGLELVEWLDGEQMTAAKGRESQRDQIHRVLAVGWEQEYRPKNFRGAFVEFGNERIARKDEAPHLERLEYELHRLEINQEEVVRSRAEQTSIPITGIAHTSPHTPST